jgi:hypothetical protein
MILNCLCLVLKKTLGKETYRCVLDHILLPNNLIVFNRHGTVRLNLMGPNMLPSFVHPTPCIQMILLG